MSESSSQLQPSDAPSEPDVGERLAALLAKSSDLIVVVDANLKVVWRSASVRYLPSTSFLDYIHGDDAPSVGDAFRRVLQSPGKIELLTYRAMGSGDDHPVIESVLRNCSDDPRVGGILVNSRDVTRQTRAEETLRRSERALNAVIEEMPLGIAICREGRLSQVNRALEALTAHPRVELIGMVPADLVAADDRARGAVLLESTASGRPLPTQELKIIRKEGGVAETEFSSLSLAVDGEPAQLLFFTDVTERKALRARVAFTDRMVSVGTLAAGVAHEVNNPLAFMTMNLAFVAQELERLSLSHALGQELVDVMNALRDARSGCHRVREIVRDLRTFSRADQEARANVDVTHVLETCLSMTRNETRHRAQLVKDLQPVPPVLANHAQLAQVFLNLLLNAAQAIHEGDAGNNEIFVGARHSDGKVFVTVRDTGSGIPAKILPRVFDPFFTTKPVGTATGLGLSICHNIVTALGGTIHITTTEGSGTTFNVELPAAAGQTATQGAPTHVRPPRGTLLIIDDDESIGLSLTRTLREAHDITYVEDARKALQQFREGRTYDSILCDLLMPDMSGKDLYDVMLAEFPTQAERMIFMTAGAFMPEAADFFGTRARWRLEKPFSIDQVEAMITEMRAALKKP